MTTPKPSAWPSSASGSYRTGARRRLRPPKKSRRARLAFSRRCPLVRPNLEGEPRAAVGGTVRLGIVSMVRQPELLRPDDIESYHRSVLTWLAHHAALGFERFYLQVEDSPSLCHLLSTGRGMSALLYGCRRDHDYRDLVTRQASVVASAIVPAREAGITFCFTSMTTKSSTAAAGPATACGARGRTCHCGRRACEQHRGVAVLGRLTQRHLSRRPRLPSQAAVCRVHQRQSFGRLAVAGLRPKGAHRFGGRRPSVELPPSVASSTLKRPRSSSGTNLVPSEGGTPPLPAMVALRMAPIARARQCPSGCDSSAPKVPFAYYRESMAAARALDAAGRGPAALEAAMDAAGSCGLGGSRRRLNCQALLCACRALVLRERRHASKAPWLDVRQRMRLEGLSLVRRHARAAAERDES